MKDTYTITYTIKGKTGALTLRAMSEDEACLIVKTQNPGCRIVHVLNYNRF